MAERLWVTNDKLGLQNTVDLGLDRAQSGDWVSGSMGIRVRAFNGWLLERARLMAGFWGEVKVNPEGTEVYIYPGQLRPVSDERKEAAIALYRTVWVLAESNRQSGVNLQTNILPPSEDVGAWPLIAAAAIVAVGQAVAIAYCVEKAAEILDRELARRDDLKQLVQRDKQVLDLAKQHQEREEKAGKQLPLDPVTKDALKAIIKQQNDIVNKIETPLQSRIPTLAQITPQASAFGIGALATIIGIGILLVWVK